MSKNSKQYLESLLAYSSSANFLQRDKNFYTDVPDVPDEEFKTYYPLENEDNVVKTKSGKNVLVEPTDDDPDENKISDVKIYDNKGEVEKLEEAPEEPSEDPTKDEIDGMQDPMAGMQNIDPMTGQPQLNHTEIGRIYELKKIYSRLLSIESQLSFSSNKLIVRIRRTISEAIELFELMISNINTFKDEIDEIIILYYKFLLKIYNLIHKFYKIKHFEDKKISKGLEE